MSDWLNRLLCFWTHARYAAWNEHGDLCCSRCDRVVWAGAAFSRAYERKYR